MLSASEIEKKVFRKEDLSLSEAMYLYNNLPLAQIAAMANELRCQAKGNENNVTWLIDRNVNITNICCSQCSFCNFYRKPGHSEGTITKIEEYAEKIAELRKLGGNQLLLQGGLHPKLGLAFYSNLFKELKNIYADLRLHALGPPEIVHIARIEKITTKEVLEKLIEAGLDSLPGAGAEILSDRVRKIISPVKCSSEEWLRVMREAHSLNLVTSATMMFNHVETPEERIEHLIKIRDVQSLKPKDSTGFISFTPWPFQSAGTQLAKDFNFANKLTAAQYIRIIAISRILLHNIKNIQASWLTVGKETAQICLHAGANDFGSIMIEENVVSSAGASYKFDINGIQQAITEAGFIPVRRNQYFEEIT
ncbi:MAG: dehypoxanthine futalosine cyclase [Bacteroidales bacterium]|nr:dehypoxanthine futalosine cyclase [Bacteroidales bacterium]